MGIIYFDTADPNDPSTQLSISYEEGDIVSITDEINEALLRKLTKENCEDFAELYFGKFGE